MKAFAITLALAGVASAASLGAQTVPTRSGVLVGTSAQRRNDCTYSRTTNSVGDIIFGRTNLNTTCTDVGTREDGGWYQVSRGRDKYNITYSSRRASLHRRARRVQPRFQLLRDGAS